MPLILLLDSIRSIIILLLLLFLGRIFISKILLSLQGSSSEQTLPTLLTLKILGSVKAQFYMLKSNHLSWDWLTGNLIPVNEFFILGENPLENSPAVTFFPPRVGPEERHFLE